MSRNGEPLASINDAVKAEDLTFGELVRPTSFTVAGGSVAAVLTTKEEINLCLTKLIIGLLRPDSGSITVYDQDVTGLTTSELLRLRQKIGVVYASGGLISNLKVWENLTLPLLYHSTLAKEEITNRGVEILQKLRYSGNLMDLPGPLSLYQKRIIGLARAMMSDPDIMVYESPCPGLNREERNFIIDAAVQFHHQKPGRTSLFITSNAITLDRLPDVTVFQPYQG